MIGSNSTVLVEHLTQTRDAHGSKTDGAPDRADVDVPAMILPASIGNLWRINLGGNYGEISTAPAEWRITDNRGRVFAPTRATYRPPIERIGESEHTLVFAELHGEVITAET